MPAPLQHLGPGDPIPLDAGTWNAMIDAGRQASRGGAAGAGSITGAMPAALYVMVRNDTGDDLPFGAVVKLGEPLTSAEDEPVEVQRLPLFAGTAPGAAGDPFAILLEPIESEVVGRAIVIGVAVCDVIVHDAGHGYAAPGTTGGTEALESAASGPAKLIHVYPGSGARRAVVQLSGTGGSDSTSDGGTAGGVCGWVQGLTSEDCLEAKILSATGRCACENTVLNVPVRLENAGANSWTSAGVIGASTVTICGVDYVLTFTRTCTGPCLTLAPFEGSGGDSVVTTHVSCSARSAVFAVGGDICNGDDAGCGPDANLVRIQVSWINSCRWAGAGWYCAKECGSDDAPAAVELGDGAQYDPTIVIVSGPYESEALAVAACEGGGEDPIPAPTPSNTCDAGAIVAPGVLYSTGPFTPPFIRYFRVPALTGQTVRAIVGSTNAALETVLNYGPAGCSYGDVGTGTGTEQDYSITLSLTSSGTNAYASLRLYAPSGSATDIVFRLEVS